MPDSTSAPPTPTLADLQRCGADELLTIPSLASDYHEMQSRLLKAAEAALAGGDQSKAAALNMVARLGSMMLEPDDPTNPFKPILVTSTARSMLPEDLTIADIGELSEFAPSLQHSLLRARLADLIWLRDRRKGVAYRPMK